MSETKNSCGEYLVKLLEAWGIDTVFGIPGVHTVELYRGVAASNLRHITPRHEQGAGFMADGYARASGRVAACFIITGPGMTNILTAMGQAYGDSIPMLVISSVNASQQLGRAEGRLHELKNQQAMVAGVAAFSHSLSSVDELPAVLERAFSVFRSQRPRPVHIEIPIDLLAADASHLSLSIPSLPARPQAEAESTATAAAMLAAASKPLLLVGGGCIDCGDSIQALAEALGAAVAITNNAKGLIPPGHPLSLSSDQSFVPVREYIAKADVILALGTELGETDYDIVFDGNFCIHGQIIRVDIDQQQLDKNFPAQLAIHSDAALFVEGLLAALDQVDNAAAARRGLQAEQAVAAIRRQLQAERGDVFAQQAAVLECIRTHLPEVILVGDSTQLVYTGHHSYEASAVRRWFHSATGYGTLGYALPAAVGAKIAQAEQAVVCLVGDGGLQFSIPELASAVEAQVPVVVLLWNNHGYGEIKKYMRRHGVEEIGVDIYTPDFELLSRGFGAHYAKVNQLDQLGEQLQRAQQRPLPTVLEWVDEDFTA